MVNGIKIGQSVDSYETYEICFDKNQVGGVQAYGEIGLVDSNGQGDKCYVKDVLPDFCGGSTPEPTPRNTPQPTTYSPTKDPTARPTTAEPTFKPTSDPTTSS